MSADNVRCRTERANSTPKSTAFVASLLGAALVAVVAIGGNCWAATIVQPAYCNAACSELGMSGNAAVPSPTPAPPFGTLKYVNQWQSQCEIWPYGAHEGNGKCKRTTTCPAGMTYFQGTDQKWYCMLVTADPGTQGGPCRPNLENPCNANLACMGGMCKPQLGEGQQCLSSSWCQKDMLCTSGVCTRSAAVPYSGKIGVICSSKCDSNGQNCVATHYDSARGTCVP